MFGFLKPGFKQITFGEGDRGGGGGGEGGIREARQAKPYLDEERSFNQAMRQARAEQGREGTFEYGGQTFRASYGQDYNGDGRITAGERMRDMTDGGGPGNSGGPFIGGGILSTVGNVVTGQFGYDMDNDGRISARERAIDMTDGGGAGRAGSRFVGGGMMGAVGNLLGGPQPREGAVPGIGAPAVPMTVSPMAPMTSPAPMQNPMTVNTLGQPVPVQPGMDPMMNPMIYAQGPRVTVPLVGQPGLPSLLPRITGMA